MRKIYTLLAVVICTITLAKAQTINQNHLATITNFIDGYNAQDFNKMRNSMSAVIKLVLTEKRVVELYSAQYQMLGNAKIDKITSKSSQSYLVELKYEKDTTETQTLGLSISEKNKIIGMSNPRVKLHFSKTKSQEELTEKDAFYKIDSILKLKHIAANFNGCVLVIKNKNEFYKNCAGFADFENKQPLNTNTLFDLASCSKQFTAMAIMQLYEKGKLNYSNKIEDYFPNFPYKNITIENLLTHTSGLPDYMELFEKHWDKNKIATNKDLLHYLAKYKPKASFKPGKEYEYSNTGYAILSSIIEAVSGKSFAVYLSENIFEPLGMKNSRVYNTKYSNKETIENYAIGHTYSSKNKQYLSVNKIPDLDYYRYLDGVTGDGAVNSTISDLLLWDNGLRTNQLVTKLTFEKAIEPYKTNTGELSNYGFGWELQKDDKFEKLIYHSGNWSGNITFVLHFLEKDISVIILSNNEYFNTPLFAIKIAAIINKLN